MFATFLSGHYSVNMSSGLSSVKPSLCLVRLGGGGHWLSGEFTPGGTAARAGLVESPKDGAGPENSNYAFSPNALSNSSMRIRG